METKTKFELKLGVATREAFGKALVEAGRQNKHVVALDADLSKSTYTHFFAKEFPDRFIECGIAEANMMAALATENPDLTKEQNEENGKKKFEEFLKKAYEQVAVSGANVSMLSPGDVVALHNYTTNDYSSMNLRLIKGFKDTETDKQYKKKIDATVQALKKLPSYEGGMTMRGEWFWPDDAIGVKPHVMHAHVDELFQPIFGN